MANIPSPGGGTATPTTSTTTTTVASVVSGTNTTWHMVVLWFLGAVALIALADPAPGIATALVLLIILGTLLTNWQTYKTYLGIK